MREKKRLEDMLATEAELVRRSDDISAYFDLAREGENVEADLRREIDALRELVDALKPRPCCRAKTTPATQS